MASWTHFVWQLPWYKNSFLNSLWYDFEEEMMKARALVEKPSKETPEDEQLVPQDVQPDALQEDMEEEPAEQDALVDGELEDQVPDVYWPKLDGAWGVKNMKRYLLAAMGTLRFFTFSGLRDALFVLVFMH